MPVAGDICDGCPGHAAGQGQAGQIGITGHIPGASRIQGQIDLFRRNELCFCSRPPILFLDFIGEQYNVGKSFDRNVT